MVTEPLSLPSRSPSVYSYLVVRFNSSNSKVIKILSQKWTINPGDTQIIYAGQLSVRCLCTHTERIQRHLFEFFCSFGWCVCVYRAPRFKTNYIEHILLFWQWVAVMQITWLRIRKIQYITLLLAFRCERLGWRVTRLVSLWLVMDVLTFFHWLSFIVWTTCDENYRLNAMNTKTKPHTKHQAAHSRGWER